VKDLGGKRTGKKEKDQTFGKREKCTNVSSVRCCIVSVRKGMENDKDTVNETGREKEMRGTVRKRDFSVIALGVYPRGWVYIADHQTK